jgi:catechol 2,3-dioxygenase-like lactoylglutathione lyase family enzyme
MSRIFGSIRQNGYVVRDIEAAIRHWTETLGVGPFFYVDSAPIEDFRYMDEPSDCRCSIALANSGALQIELIEQRNDAPSMYRDFLAAGREGLQHVAYWTENMDADLDRVAALGYRVGQSGHVGENGRFVYYTTEAHPGTVIELSEVSGRKGELFRAIREAAVNWDGANSIVRV